MIRKGFTLIELLAVIVILAIIAVITVPKVADMISSSRQGGAENSFYGTLKAAELGYTKALQSNTNLKESTCNIEDSKITCTNGVNVEVSGKTPENGVIAVSSNGVSGVNVTLNGYSCSGNLSTESPCYKQKAETTSDILKQKITTTGEGLYYDEYSDRFVYRGTNPDNYIKIDDKLWRILAIEKDNTIKIIADFVESKRAFDPLGKRTEENNPYCISAATKGCGVWAKDTKPFVDPISSGLVNEDSDINKYLNNDYYNTLSTNFKKIIVNHDFNIGVVNHKTAGVKAIMKEEKANVWKGKIGLINASDFSNSSSSIECRNASAYEVWNSRTDKKLCLRDTFLATYSHNAGYWSINSEYEGNSNGYKLAGVISAKDEYALFAWQYSDKEYSVRPVIYISDDIKLTGTGTKDNPYIVSF